MTRTYELRRYGPHTTECTLGWFHTVASAYKAMEDDALCMWPKRAGTTSKGSSFFYRIFDGTRCMAEREWAAAVRQHDTPM